MLFCNVGCWDLETGERKGRREEKRERGEKEEAGNAFSPAIANPPKILIWLSSQAPSTRAILIAYLLR
jgi:hypothetical protein